jgi:hypothetical protein
VSNPSYDNLDHHGLCWFKTPYMRIYKIPINMVIMNGFACMVRFRWPGRDAWDLTPWNKCPAIAMFKDGNQEVMHVNEDGTYQPEIHPAN